MSEHSTPIRVPPHSVVPGDLETIFETWKSVCEREQLRRDILAIQEAERRAV